MTNESNFTAAGAAVAAYFNAEKNVRLLFLFELMWTILHACAPLHYPEWVCHFQRCPVRSSKQYENMLILMLLLAIFSCKLVIYFHCDFINVIEVYFLTSSSSHTPLTKSLRACMWVCVLCKLSIIIVHKYTCAHCFRYFLTPSCLFCLHEFISTYTHTHRPRTQRHDEVKS